MPSSKASGTQTATVTTEHTLGSAITDAGTYVLIVDTAEMVNGDVLELRAKLKVLTGGSELLTLIGTYAHVQAEPVKISIPLPSLFSITFTLKQAAGSSRDFDWNVIEL